MSETSQSSTENSESRGCGPLISKGNQSTRSLRLQVFERVRAAGLIARVDVAKKLGVSPGSVTPVVADLLETGLLIEETSPVRDTDAGRGRPRVAIGVRAEAGYVAGIKLSDQTHTAVVMDFAGNLIGYASHPSAGVMQSVDATLSAAEQVLKNALAPIGFDAADLKAVGVGVPGVVDSQNGHVLWSPLIDQDNVRLQSALSAKLGLPVEIDNDANLVTLAELWFGAGRALSDFAVVTIEHGVGMGLVLGNRLYRGAMGLGMELGHTKVQLDGALCRCGQRGCLEAYVADYALVREASIALYGIDHNIQGQHTLLESLHEHAKSGNDAARAIFDRAGRYLAVGLANVVTLFDPPLILLSGERMHFDYLYAEEVLEEIETLTLKTVRKLPKVEIHAWGDLLWAKGAAALALEAATQMAITSGSAS